MKKSKPPAGMKTMKPRNTDPSKVAAGDFRGSGVKQPMGRQKDSYIDVPMGKKMKPPKSMA
jgi:hypothetical protein